MILAAMPGPDHQFTPGHGESAPAIDFAYRDVARAFQSFLQQIPDNSPFIIASHSQGTLHGQRLLQQEIDGSTLRQRRTSRQHVVPMVFYILRMLKRAYMMARAGRETTTVWTTR
ncbi:MAG: DUF3089 domain-containing protein, partial [Halioglobus sp.]